MDEHEEDQELGNIKDCCYPTVRIFMRSIGYNITEKRDAMEK